MFTLTYIDLENQTSFTKLHILELIFIFRLMGVVMSNIQFSAIDNAKMTCQKYKY